MLKRFLGSCVQKRLCIPQNFWGTSVTRIPRDGDTKKRVHGGIWTFKRFCTNLSLEQCTTVHWCLPIRIRRLSRVHCTGHWLTPRPIHCTPLHCTEIYSFQDQRNTPYFITEIHLTLSQKYSLHDLAKTCSGHLLTHHPLLKCTKHDIALHCIEPHNALQSIVKHL